MRKRYSLKELSTIRLDLDKPKIIFLRGDLGAGKTTLSKHIFNNLLDISDDIRSPTYTYYNKYQKHYHFDLYRLQSYDEFFAIGGEEILDNNEGVILVEWPNFLEEYYKPDIEIIISKTSDDEIREIEILEKKKKL